MHAGVDRLLALAWCSALIACAGGDAGPHDAGPQGPSSATEVVTPTTFNDATGARVDTNMNPNDLESSTFIDRNGDGNFDQLDQFDVDGDGVGDDFNGDGFPDNRFYFDDRAPWIPDADSFDDYENVELGIPRGMTPVPGDCPADGIATGPLDLGFTTWQPSSYCAREQPQTGSDPREY